MFETKKLLCVVIATFLVTGSASATTYTRTYSRPVDAGDNALPQDTNCGKNGCRNALHRYALIKTHAGLKRVANYPRPTRNNASLGLVISTCSFREITPGVQRPESDAFLGCNMYFDGVNVSGGPRGSNTIATRVGTPNQDAPPCEGTNLAVNDDFFAVKDQRDSVRDVNAVWVGGTVVGWILQGVKPDKHSKGGFLRYYQPNASSQPSININVSWKFLSAGFTPQSGPGPIIKWNGMLLRGSRMAKCFTKGRRIGD